MMVELTVSHRQSNPGRASSSISSPVGPGGRVGEGDSAGLSDFRSCSATCRHRDRGFPPPCPPRLTKEEDERQEHEHCTRYWSGVASADALMLIPELPA